MLELLRSKSLEVAEGRQLNHVTHRVPKGLSEHHPLQVEASSEYMTEGDSDVTKVSGAIVKEDVHGKEGQAE